MTLQIQSANLKSQMQSRINALSLAQTAVNTPHSASDIMLWSNRVKGLGIDIVPLQTILDLSISFVDGSTSTEDLTMLNAARSIIEKQGLRNFKFPMCVGQNGSINLKGIVTGIALSPYQLSFWSEQFVDLSSVGIAGHYTAITPANPVIFSGVGVAGNLTHIVTPSLTAISDVVVDVIADGISYKFKYDSIMGSGNLERILLGGFIQGLEPKVVVSDTVGHGSAADYGFQPRHAFMVSPMVAEYEGIGIPFEHSLSVSVTSTEAFGSSSNGEFAGIMYRKKNDLI